MPTELEVKTTPPPVAGAITDPGTTPDADAPPVENAPPLAPKERYLGYCLVTRKGGLYVLRVHTIEDGKIVATRDEPENLIGVHIGNMIAHIEDGQR